MDLTPIVTPEEHRRNIDAADEILRQDLARLRFGNGAPRFVPHEMDRLEQAARSKHRATFTAAQEAFAAEAASIQERRDRLDRLEANPLGLLTGAALQEANTMNPFVQEDCQSLPLDTLIQRVEDAIAAKPGSLPTKALLARYLALRLAKERGERRGMLTDDGQRLADALKDLQGNLFPAHARKRANLDDLDAMLEEAQSGSALGARAYLDTAYSHRTR